MEKSTRARFLFIPQQFNGAQPLEGDTFESETILRFTDGRLNDRGIEPAVETNDGHFEYHRMGQLHRELEPAIIDDWGNWVEYWRYGVIIWAGYACDSPYSSNEHVAWCVTNDELVLVTRAKNSHDFVCADTGINLVVQGLSVGRLGKEQTVEPVYLATDEQEELYHIRVKPEAI